MLDWRISFPISQLLIFPFSFAIATQIFTTLEKCIETSKEKQLKLLKEQHDSQIGGDTKSIHTQVSREFKILNKKHKDKDELDRWHICPMALFLVSLIRDGP